MAPHPWPVMKTKFARVHAGGLLFKEGRKEVGFSWEEIVGLQQNVVGYSINLVPAYLPGMTSYRYTIIDVHGKKRLLTESWAKFSKLYNHIVEHTLPIIRQRAMVTTAGGQGLLFALLAFDPSGMSYGKRCYLRDNILSIEVVSGRLAI